MAINFDYPIREKNGKKRHVKIVSNEGRLAGFPIMGYVGDEIDLTSWTLEGTGRYSYITDIENIPFKTEVWVVLFTNYEIEFFGSCRELDDLKHRIKATAEKRAILSVIRIKDIEIPIGQRDDEDTPLLDGIVSEFAE